jgi:hypothetical protein
MAHDRELILKLAECAAACEICLDSCLSEDDVKMMTECIRLDRDCAKICALTGSMIASHSSFAGQMVKLCEEICEKCADECSRHKYDHCQQCAESCRECASACRSFSNVEANH